MTDTTTAQPAARKPPWLRVRAPAGAGYRRLRELVRRYGLHTVCQSARCPNVGECWSAGTATLMILGGRCTRACGFCAVPSGPVGPPEADEPARVARATRALGLRHVVITSVTRDDLPDGGAELWARTIRAVRRECPGVTVEALVPDFGGRRRACGRVIAAAPDVFAHNVETVPRLYPQVRPQAQFERSLALLEWAGRAGLTTKSGLMLGMGESRSEVLEVLRRLRQAGVRIVTLGQYLRPAPGRIPVVRYVPPREFDELGARAREMGFEAVASAPLVRSSYRAEVSAAAVAGAR